MRYELGDFEWGHHVLTSDDGGRLRPPLRLLDGLPHLERRAGRIDVADAVDRQRVDDGVDAGG